MQIRRIGSFVRHSVDNNLHIDAIIFWTNQYSLALEGLHLGKKDYGWDCIEDFLGRPNILLLISIIFFLIFFFLNYSSQSLKK